MTASNPPSMEDDSLKTPELRAFKYKKGDIVFGTRQAFELLPNRTYVFQCKSDFALPPEYSFEPVIMNVACAVGIEIISKSVYRNLELFSVCIKCSHPVKIGKYFPIFNVKIFRNYLEKVKDANLMLLNDEDDYIFKDIDF